MRSCMWSDSPTLASAKTSLVYLDGTTSILFLVCPLSPLRFLDPADCILRHFIFQNDCERQCCVSMWLQWCLKPKKKAGGGLGFPPPLLRTQMFTAVSTHNAAWFHSASDKGAAIRLMNERRLRLCLSGSGVKI